MQATWKIYVKDKGNLRELLNLVLLNREAEIAIRRKDGLELYFKLQSDEMELVSYISQEMNNRVVQSPIMPTRKENIFFSNLPKMYFNSLFSFFLETSVFSIKGDVVYARVENYHTWNPLRKKMLGRKTKQALYTAKIYSPFLLRAYSSKTGKQSLTLGSGYPIIITANEMLALINGGDDNGLLAI